jgi:hypothetical protein
MKKKIEAKSKDTEKRIPIVMAVGYNGTGKSYSKKDKHMIDFDSPDKRLSYKFEPDTELLKFAEEFSNTCKLLSAKDYVSENEKYHIRYKNFLQQRLKQPTTSIFRIGHSSKRIEINRKYIIAEKDMTPNFIFAMILWCIVRFETYEIHPFSPYDLADMITLDYYLKTGRPPKDFIRGMNRQLAISVEAGMCPPDFFERCKNIKLYLKKKNKRNDSSPQKDS